MAGPEDVADGNVTPVKRPALDIDSIQNKKFKTEELPITAAQRAAIDNLLFSFKKKGGFDNIRKTVWAEFNDGVSASTLFTLAWVLVTVAFLRKVPNLINYRKRRRTLQIH